MGLPLAPNWKLLKPTSPSLWTMGMVRAELSQAVVASPSTLDSLFGSLGRDRDDGCLMTEKSESSDPRRKAVLVQGREKGGLLYHCCRYRRLSKMESWLYSYQHRRTIPNHGSGHQEPGHGWKLPNLQKATRNRFLPSFWPSPHEAHHGKTLPGSTAV